jgi:hypothetical protein
MAAAKGNQYYKNREKDGRPKAIESPEVMYELFQEYCEHTKANPIKVKDWVGGMAKPVIREKEIPYTLEGFEIYCFKQGIISHIDHYFSNREGRYEEFVGICSRIRREIRDDQIKGGMAGIFNPSITQRLNNLVEKTENKHEVSEIKITRDR